MSTADDLVRDLGDDDLASFRRGAQTLVDAADAEHCRRVAARPCPCGRCGMTFLEAVQDLMRRQLLNRDQAEASLRGVARAESGAPQ